MPKYKLMSAFVAAGILAGGLVSSDEAAAKTCKSFSVAVQGERKTLNLSARASARWHWHRRVLRDHGFVWSTYFMARGKSYSCSRSGLRWRCTAHGRPCRA